MTLFLASVLLGILPMTLYAFLVWRVDRWEKEPWPLLFAAFVWGFLPSAIFAIIAQTILGLPVEMSGEPTLMSELYQASFLAPVTEELIKGLGVFLVMRLFARQVDSVLDGMIYGGMVGFGFSAIENILYFVGMPDPASLAALFFFRALVFGFLHAMFTGLIGIGFALGKFTKVPAMRFLWPLLGLGAARFTHAHHNYFATIGGATILYAVAGCATGMLFFLVLIGVCLYHENRWIRIHLSPEVDAGVLFPQQAIDAASFGKRTSLTALSLGFRASRQRHRLLHAATRLAYKKRQRERFGEEWRPGLAGEIERWRAEVRRLSREDPLVVSGKIASGGRLPPPLPPTRSIPPPLPTQRSAS